MELFLHMPNDYQGRYGDSRRPSTPPSRPAPRPYGQRPGAQQRPYQGTQRPGGYSAQGQRRPSSSGCSGPRYAQQRRPGGYSQPPRRGGNGGEPSRARAPPNVYGAARRFSRACARCKPCFAAAVCRRGKNRLTAVRLYRCPRGFESFSRLRRRIFRP